MNDQSPTWQRGAANLFKDDTLDTVSTVCDLLSNQRRQFVVFYLASIPEQWVSVSEVSRWVTAVYYDQSISESRGAEYKNVRESMRHTHVDVLEEADVVEVDDRGTEMRRGPRFERVAAILVHLLAASL
ncbi:hypothetical protein ACFQJ5_12575 [Halomicroarcula sp. GCM10025324]|uniref:DUF7344 domain-containing protein n=1 Tax=Haloarcula TaxID=2237 RepID=UPI0023E84B46|nr:hypothetical protein [Halomicroarcula sp. ZS-22-S1]